MILVVLSHGWAIAPYDDWWESGWRQVLSSGNFAVTIFFVVGGYFLVRSLLREVDRDGRINIIRELLRRVLRIAIPVYVLLAVVLGVAALQDTPDYSSESTRRSVGAIATFTWNWFLQNSMLIARPDLGHLWYVSVYMQVTVALVILVALTVRHRRVAMLLLAVSVVAMVAWSFNCVANEPIMQALLRTTTRADAMLVGALVAFALHATSVPKRFTRWAPVLLGVGGAGTIALVTIPSTTEQYLGWHGIASMVTSAMMLVAILWLPERSAITAPLRVRPLVSLGHNSLSIYIWHYPLFWFVGQHGDHWRWQTSAAIALVALAVVVSISRQLIEEPVAAMIDQWAVTSRASREAVDAEASDGPEEPAATAVPDEVTPTGDGSDSHAP